MAYVIQNRGDTAANWTSVDPVLAEREIGLETDTNKLKVGDGVTAWTSLAYFGGTYTSPLTTKGDVFTYSTADARLAVGTNGYVLTADSAEATGLKWVAPSGGSSAFSAITGSTNTTAAMVVGTGASLAASGSGTIEATSCTGNSATVTTNANLTGHVTSVGNAAVLGSFTKAQLDTAISDGNALYVGDITQYTDELAQDAIGAMVDSTLVYVDGTPLLTRAALTGDVTAAQASNATTIAANAVTNAKAAQMATQTIKGRTTAGTGNAEDLTATQATAILNAAVGDAGSGGTKGLVPAPATGDATKFLRGDMTYQTIAGGDALVANPLSQFAATTSLQLKGVISDETGSGALVFADTPTLVTPVLGVATATSINGATITSGTLNGSVTGTNTGDQTSIVGISGTKAQFDTAVTDGDFLYVGDAPALSQTISLSFYLLTCSNITIALDAKAAFGYTIDSIRGLDLSAGTITAEVQINGTPVTGLTALSATTTAQDATATAANVVAAGDRVTLVLSSNAAATGMEFTLKSTRTLS